MLSSKKIGFDLDGIFIGPPLFIPRNLVEQLYKRSSHNLSYRIPGDFEKKIRIISHHHLLRPPIKENIRVLKSIAERPDLSISLISSRFSFLKEKTNKALSYNHVKENFNSMYFNLKNEQPHLFKNRLIKKEGIGKFVDDDLDLLLFLAKENPDVKFYWVGISNRKIMLPKNITKIKNLGEFYSKYL